MSPDFDLTHQPGEGFHIEGFPEAVKFVRLTGAAAQKVADLSLHRLDIELAIASLEGINDIAPLDSPVLQESLWRSAIAHLMKCFGSSRSRTRLSATEILSREELPLEVFGYFQTLRNKHVVHDENAYAQSIPGAVLNRSEVSPRIAKIITFSAVGSTLNQDNYVNLRLLCDRALAWVNAEFDVTCEALTRDLERLPYAELEAMDAVSYTVPTLDDLRKPRV